MGKRLVTENHSYPEQVLFFFQLNPWHVPDILLQEASFGKEGKTPVPRNAYLVTRTQKPEGKKYRKW
jgi:hypothetical protein